MKNYNTKYSKILTKIFLIKEYTINKKSTYQIAKEIGCSYESIFRYLIKYNIPIRTHSESLIGKYKGKNNPNFGNKWTEEQKQALSINRIKNGRFKGNKAGNFVDGRCSKIYYCIEKDCNNEISYNTWLKGSKLCQYCGHKGKLNGNWKNGLTLNPYPTEWTESLKELIRQRDNRQCQICGKLEKDCYRKLDVHHMDYDKENLNPKNLISLCSSCHIVTNYSRETYIEFFKTLKENNICLI